MKQLITSIIVLALVCSSLLGCVDLTHEQDSNQNQNPGESISSEVTSSPETTEPITTEPEITEPITTEPKKTNPVKPVLDVEVQNSVVTSNINILYGWNGSGLKIGYGRFGQLNIGFDNPDELDMVVSASKGILISNYLSAKGNVESLSFASAEYLKTDDSCVVDSDLRSASSMVLRWFPLNFTPDQGIPFITIKFYREGKIIGYSVFAVVTKGSEGDYTYTLNNVKTEIDQTLTEESIVTKIYEAKALYR